MLVVKFRRKPGTDTEGGHARVQVFTGSSLGGVHPDAITVGLCGEIVMTEGEWAMLQTRLRADAIRSDTAGQVAFRVGRP